MLCACAHRGQRLTSGLTPQELFTSVFESGSLTGLELSEQAGLLEIPVIYSPGLPSSEIINGGSWM